MLLTRFTPFLDLLSGAGKQPAHPAEGFLRRRVQGMVVAVMSVARRIDQAASAREIEAGLGSPFEEALGSFRAIELSARNACDQVSQTVEMGI